MKAAFMKDTTRRPQKHRVLDIDALATREMSIVVREARQKYASEVQKDDVLLDELKYAERVLQRSLDRK